MGYSNKIAWETLRTVNSASLGGTYVALGTPLANASYICKIVNNSTVLVTVSIDGATDIDVAPANSFFLYDESKSGAGGSNPFGPALPAGTQFYIKSGTGGAGTGSIYLVTQFIVVQ